MCCTDDCATRAGAEVPPALTDRRGRRPSSQESVAHILLGELGLLGVNVILERRLRVDHSRVGGLLLAHQLPRVRLITTDDLLPGLELEWLQEAKNQLQRQ